MTLDLAPYDEDGNLMYRATWGVQEWRDVAPFPAVLRLIGFERSGCALWENYQTGEQYPMFLADLAEMLTKRSVNYGRVGGRWTVRKVGDCYGLALVTDA